MSQFQRKIFILRMNGDRPVLFTPLKYDARTGLLHGFDNAEKPLSVPVDERLKPYQPIQLEWDDD